VPAPKERDLEQTRKDLEAWLATRLPDADAGDVHVGELSGPGTTGFSSDTLIFDARWRSGGADVSESLVARLRPSGMTVFPEYDIARQYRIQRILEERGIPTAPMRWLEEDERFLGAPFYVMGRVDGRIPTDTPPYHTGGWVAEIEPAEREALWWSGVDTLAAIHRVDWRASGLDFLERPGATPLDAHLEQWERMHAWVGGRPKPQVEYALRWMREQRPEDPEPTVLAWGDARIGNMIFGDDGRCAAVLDWEMAELGSPELDVAWFLFLDRHHSQGMGVERLKGFPSREATVARYEEKSGFRVRHLHYYEVFAALRFTILMARIAHQMTHYGFLPADSNFEVDNNCSRLLATLLELPPPGAA
jgi:aminoglycoside phosphotransferase (APT) family kinase protein